MLNLDLGALCIWMALRFAWPPAIAWARFPLFALATFNVAIGVEWLARYDHSRVSLNASATEATWTAPSSRSS